ncbi:MAG: hypothetical protein IKJ18_01425 [Bacteroidaceae bacterium]|nr:hypothetical protein [Bacteroidaceae bacterium]
MKQAYIKPETEVIDIETETHLMALSADEALPGTSWGGDDGTGKDADATGRRGTWGNLWAQE